MTIHVNPADRSVENYQAIIRAMIENDEACQSPVCGITMFGHLVDGMPDSYMNLLKELDESYVEKHGPVVETVNVKSENGKST